MSGKLRLRSYRGGPPRCSQEADDAVERAALDLMEHYFAEEAAGRIALEHLGVVGVGGIAVGDDHGIPATTEGRHRELHDLLSDLSGGTDGSGGPELPPVPGEPLTLEHELEFEARRTSMRGSRDHREMLVAHARPLAQWAESQGVWNPRARARFGVLRAYDAIWTCRIRERLHQDPRALVWYWANIRHGHRRCHFQQCWPRLGGGSAPPIFPRDFEKLGHLRDVNLDAPSLEESEWAGETPFIRYLDPLRPPLVALMAAAKIIRAHSQGSSLDVVGVELGHSFAAQALSVWLGSSRIWTTSALFNPDLRPSVAHGIVDTGLQYGKRRPSLEPGKADAVVLNVPDRVAEDFVKLALDEDVPLTRAAIDEMWQRPRIDLARGLDESVAEAVAHLREGGVFVALGDVGSGATHLVQERIDSEGGFDRVAGPTLVNYEREPWAPYGVVRPTGRLVAAWRRSA